MVLPLTWCFFLWQDLSSCDILFLPHLFLSIVLIHLFVNLYLFLSDVWCFFCDWKFLPLIVNIYLSDRKFLPVAGCFLMSQEDSSDDTKFLSVSGRLYIWMVDFYVKRSFCLWQEVFYRQRKIPPVAKKFLLVIRSTDWNSSKFSNFHGWLRKTKLYLIQPSKSCGFDWTDQEGCLGKIPNGISGEADYTVNSCSGVFCSLSWNVLSTISSISFLFSFLFSPLALFFSQKGYQRIWNFAWSPNSQNYYNSTPVETKT